jgi:hypothetical protein
MAGDEQLRMEKPWRLILIVDDKEAVRVAAAYYTLPVRKRDDLAAIRAIAGIDSDVSSILTRLRAAGMLDHDEPPPVLERLMSTYVVSKISKGRS